MKFDFTLPGEYTIPPGATMEERIQASREFTRVRNLGHGIICNTTVEADGVLSTIRVTHYLTCGACARMSKEQKDGKVDEVPKDTPAS